MIEENTSTKDLKKLFLSAKEVCYLIGFSRVSLWRASKDGQFPSPKQLTIQRVGWLREDVENWIKSRPDVHQKKEGVSV